MLQTKETIKIQKSSDKNQEVKKLNLTTFVYLITHTHTNKHTYRSHNTHFKYKDIKSKKVEKYTLNQQ